MPDALARAEVVAFLRAEADKQDLAASARRQSAAVWRGGTDEEYRQGAALATRQTGRLHQAPSAAERRVLADTDDRIAAKIEARAALYRRAVELIEGGDDA